MSRPKSAAVKDIDVDIADILDHGYRYCIDIGKGDVDPPLVYTHDRSLQPCVAFSVCIWLGLGLRLALESYRYSISHLSSAVTSSPLCILASVFRNGPHKTPLLLHTYQSNTELRLSLYL